VTDGRGNDTVYTLNLNGSPLRIQEPLGVVTEMEWSPSDIFKTRETDAEGRVTDFEYDGDANLVKETIHAGGDIGEVVTEFEYHPVFQKMTLKRVHNVDSEGRPVLEETHFLINDTNGNLEKVTDAEGNKTEYRYKPNGDLELVLGPRAGQVTTFTYDDFGNPETTAWTSW
jgi:YD repeat-containing protein